MQVSELLEYVPESISLILEPTQNKGALYLGNITSLFKSTQKYQIKAAISICEDLDLKEVQLEQHLRIVLNDLDNSNIKQYFDQTNQFIQSNLNKGNLLVHCMAGVSRSAAIVIAYLMWSQKMTFQNALIYVTKKREQVYPNKGFRQQLIQYEEELKTVK
ncbi:unnamed protein product [Paramecium pentaurelia]|uniref:protein-tyrosine-phosphatase n=1 Tax=Paramecium pentaurelia TaxID=43138 RepID=A0A8S1UBV6_9CILI|nr:unnamed protein product [Paramecium pentaurelia]